MKRLRQTALLASFWLVTVALAQGNYTVTNWGVLAFQVVGDKAQPTPLPDDRVNLPDFIPQITKQARKGPAWLRLGVLQFQTDEGQTLEMTLQTPLGILTQWWPSANSVAPRLSNRPLQVLKDGQLAWTGLELRPKETPEYRSLPADCLFGPLREASRTGLIGNGVAEAMVFYRGLLDQPPGVVALPGTAPGSLMVRNQSGQALQQVMVLAVHRDKSWWQVIPAMAPGATLEVAAPAHLEKLETMALAASSRWREVVTQAGLDEKNVGSMMALNEQAWFHEEGLRLLYLAPGDLIAKLTPIKFAPEPRSLTRVLVNQVDCPAPWELDHMRELIAALGAISFKEREAAEAELRDLGKEIEPMLKDEFTRSDDPEVRFRLRNLLQAMGALPPVKANADAAPVSDIGRLKQLMLMNGGRRLPANIVIEDEQQIDE
jgi:hypothetical protein